MSGYTDHDVGNMLQCVADIINDAPEMLPSGGDKPLWRRKILVGRSGETRFDGSEQKSASKGVQN